MLTLGGLLLQRSIILMTFFAHVLKLSGLPFVHVLLHAAACERCNAKKHPDGLLLLLLCAAHFMHPCFCAPALSALLLRWRSCLKTGGLPLGSPQVESGLAGAGRAPGLPQAESCFTGDNWACATRHTHVYVLNKLSGKLQETSSAAEGGGCG
eukprot:scaffold97917_cov24-Tisochrysis_lutea.AAC.1